MDRVVIKNYLSTFCLVRYFLTISILQKKKTFHCSDRRNPYRNRVKINLRLIPNRCDKTILNQRDKLTRKLRSFLLLSRTLKSVQKYTRKKETGKLCRLNASRRIKDELFARRVINSK